MNHRNVKKGQLIRGSANSFKQQSSLSQLQQNMRKNSSTVMDVDPTSLAHTYGNTNIQTPQILLPTLNLKNRTIVSKGYKRNIQMNDGSKSSANRYFNDKHTSMSSPPYKNNLAISRDDKYIYLRSSYFDGEDEQQERKPEVSNVVMGNFQSSVYRNQITELSKHANDQKNQVERLNYENHQLNEMILKKNLVNEELKQQLEAVQFENNQNLQSLEQKEDIIFRLEDENAMLKANLMKLHEEMNAMKVSQMKLKKDNETLQQQMDIVQKQGISGQKDAVSRNQLQTQSKESKNDKTKKGKFKKKVEPALPDFTNIDYELMLIDRHKQKPDDVKALYQAAYMKALQDETVRNANEAQFKKFFEEADDNSNAILDFEEYKVFMKRYNEVEKQKYGGANEFSEQDLKLIFEATLCEYQDGITIQDIHKRADKDKWLLKKLYDDQKDEQCMKINTKDAKKFMETYKQVLQRHNRKSDPVKIAYENAVMKLSTDLKLKQQFLSRQEKFFNEVDRNSNDLLEFDEYENFVKKQQFQEQSDYGTCQNLSPLEVKELYKLQSCLQLNRKQGITIEDVRKRTDIDIWIFSQLAKNRKAKPQFQKSLNVIINIGLLNMLTGQYDKLAIAQMKNAKIEKKKIGDVEPFTYIEYEIMLINRHHKKPNDVKALNGAAHKKAQKDDKVKKKNEALLEQFFKEADDNDNGVFDFEEFKIFMQKVTKYEIKNFGGTNNFSEDDLKLIFEATQHEFRGGVTLSDIKRRANMDKWLFKKLYDDQREEDCVNINSDVAQQYMETYHSILERHNKKPDKVKIAYENAIMKLSSDLTVKEQFLEKQLQFFNEADSSQSGALGFSGYQNLVKKQEELEQADYGTGQNLTPIEIKEIFQFMKRLHKNVTIEAVRKRTDIDIWIFSQLAKNRKAKLEYQKSLTIIINIGLLNMLTGQYDKLSQSNMKKAKIEKRKIGEGAPFEYIEYEIMLINRHLQKPFDVKSAFENDYFIVQKHKSLISQYDAQIEQFFKDADDNNNGVFDFEEFKIFMEMKSDWENIQYGGTNNFNQQDLKLIFKETQHEFRDGVTLDDIKRRMRMDKWLMERIMNQNKSPDCHSMDTPASQAYMETYHSILQRHEKVKAEQQQKYEETMLNFGNAPKSKEQYVQVLQENFLELGKVLNLEQYTTFMRNVDKYEKTQFGQCSRVNLTDEEIQELFQAIIDLYQDEEKEGVTFNDVKLRLEVDIWIFSQLAEHRKQKDQANSEKLNIRILVNKGLINLLTGYFCIHTFSGHPDCPDGTWEYRKPHGKLTEFFQAKHDQGVTMQNQMIEQMGLDAILISPENYAQMRETFAGMFKAGHMSESDDLMDQLAKEDDGLTSTQIIQCPTEDGQQINLYITRPRDLPDSNQPCFIFNHGGGCVLFSSQICHEYGLGKKFALQMHCVVVLPEFRNCPEVRQPKGGQDVAEAVKFIYNQADTFGIDKSKIALAGQSGGSSVSLTGALLLARTNQAHMIKALFLCCPMISMAYEDLPQAQYLQWEQDLKAKEHSKAFFKMGSIDFDKQWAEKDPMLFPGRMSVEDAEKLPKTCLMTSEFDTVRRDARMMAETLKQTGNFLGIHEMPGCPHGYEFYMKQKETIAFYDDLNRAFLAWVVNN